MRRAWKWGMAAVALAGVAGWLLWPREAVTRASPIAARPARLREFVSQPVNELGETVRYKMLLPDGWTPHVPGQFDDKKLATAGADGNLYCAMSAVPNVSPQPPDPGGIGLEPQAFLIVGHNRKKYSSASSVAAIGSDQIEAVYSLNQRAVASAFQHGRRYEIEYCRNNRAEFDSTYRQICESFRVIREK